MNGQKHVEYVTKLFSIRRLVITNLIKTAAINAFTEVLLQKVYITQVHIRAAGKSYHMFLVQQQDFIFFLTPTI